MPARHCCSYLGMVELCSHVRTGAYDLFRFALASPPERHRNQASVRGTHVLLVVWLAADCDKKFARFPDSPRPKRITPRAVRARVTLLTFLRALSGVESFEEGMRVALLHYPAVRSRAEKMWLSRRVNQTMKARSRRSDNCDKTPAPRPVLDVGTSLTKVSTPPKSRAMHFPTVSVPVVWDKLDALRATRLYPKNKGSGVFAPIVNRPNHRLYLVSADPMSKGAAGGIRCSSAEAWNQFMLTVPRALRQAYRERFRKAYDVLAFGMAPGKTINTWFKYYSPRTGMRHFMLPFIKCHLCSRCALVVTTAAGCDPTAYCGRHQSVPSARRQLSLGLKPEKGVRMPVPVVKPFPRPGHLWARNSSGLPPNRHVQHNKPKVLRKAKRTKSRFATEPMRYHSMLFEQTVLAASARARTVVPVAMSHDTASVCTSEPEVYLTRIRRKAGEFVRSMLAGTHLAQSPNARTVKVAIDRDSKMLWHVEPFVGSGRKAKQAKAVRIGGEYYSHAPITKRIRPMRHEGVEYRPATVQTPVRPTARVVEFLEVTTSTEPYQLKDYICCFGYVSSMVVGLLELEVSAYSPLRGTPPFRRVVRAATSPNSAVKEADRNEVFYTASLEAWYEINWREKKHPGYLAQCSSCQQLERGAIDTSLVNPDARGITEADPLEELEYHDVLGADEVLLRQNNLVEFYDRYMLLLISETGSDCGFQRKLPKPVWSHHLHHSVVRWSRQIRRRYTESVTARVLAAAATSSDYGSLLQTLKAGNPTVNRGHVRGSSSSGGPSGQRQTLRPAGRKA